MLLGVSYQLSVISYQLSASEGKRQQARGKRKNLAILLPKKGYKLSTSKLLA
jgi:hypothetical protein